MKISPQTRTLVCRCLLTQSFIRVDRVVLDGKVWQRCTDSDAFQASWTTDLYKKCKQSAESYQFVTATDHRRFYKLHSKMKTLVLSAFLLLVAIALIDAIPLDGAAITNLDEILLPVGEEQVDGAVKKSGRYECGIFDFTCCSLCKAVENFSFNLWKPWNPSQG